MFGNIGGEKSLQNFQMWQGNCHISLYNSNWAERGCGVGTSERRMAIWHTLCIQRRVTIPYLSAKYGVSPRTIRYDVEALSRIYPIETRCGKNGGVKLADWYQPGIALIQPEQMDLLLKLHERLEGNEAALMSGIISALSEAMRL